MRFELLFTRTALALTFLLAAPGCPVQASSPAWDPTWDDRFGVIAFSKKDPANLDLVGCKLWYDYTASAAASFPGYDKLFLYHTADPNRSAAAIQQDAINAKNAHPGQTIWWAMSNEPNDLQQSNQHAAPYATLYLHYHRNLRIGDPDCRIIGPGILNWTFQSTSVYQTGKSWYEEFRDAWHNNPDCTAYSEANYGVSYPPMDAFNFHSYDLRGVQGTPWAPISWEYCANEILACYADVLTYPEVLNKKIWLTEYSALRATTQRENRDHCLGLVAWMRHQPFLDRWIYFALYVPETDYWARLRLLQEDNSLTESGELMAYLARMPEEDDIALYPSAQDFSGFVPYTRPGWVSSPDMQGIQEDLLRFNLVQNTNYSGSSMLGARIPVGGTIQRVIFDFAANYDNDRVQLQLDTNLQQGFWAQNQFGSSSGRVDLTFPPGTHQVSFSLAVQQNFFYPYATGEWNGRITYLEVFYTPRPAMMLMGE